MAAELRPNGTPAAGGRSANPQAQFDQALELLRGSQAATEGPRAIGLIEAASAMGHPDATALSALFRAMGAGNQQSWGEALAKLEVAAQAGSIGAQRQLDVLRRRGHSPEQLLAVPQRQVLSESPRIVVFPGFATAAECDWAIERARDGLKRATVFNTNTGDQTYDSARDNSAVEFQLPDMDVVLEVLRGRISAATHLPVPIFEPLQVLHYSVGEQFHPHHDFLDPDVPEFAELLRRFGQRIATVLVYLNDEYEGGETVFPKLGIRFRGRRGDALFFTNVDRSGHPDRSTTHAGKPPTSGEKWIISQWIRDRAPMSPFVGDARGSEGG